MSSPVAITLTLLTPSLTLQAGQSLTLAMLPTGLQGAKGDKGDTGDSGASEFSDIGGSPSDNPALSDALDAKANAADLDGITFTIVGTFLHVTKSGTTRKIRLLDL